MSTTTSPRRPVGLVRPRGRGVWQIAATVGYDEKGKRRRVWRIVRGSKVEAERELARLIAGGVAEASGRTTLDAFLTEQWLPHIRPRLRPRTADGYEDVIRRYIRPHLGGVPLRGLTPIAVERWLQRLRVDGGAAGKLSERTLLSAFRVLRTALRQAVKWRVIDRDPTDAVQAPRPARFPAPAIAAEQARAVLGAFAGHPLEPAVALALGAGLRAGEVAGLSWSAVDLDAGFLRVDRTLQRVRAEGKWLLEFGEPKSDRSRRVLDLPAWTVELLRAHRKRQAERRLFLGEAWADLDLVMERGDGAPLGPLRPVGSLPPAAGRRGAPTDPVPRPSARARDAAPGRRLPAESHQRAPRALHDRDHGGPLRPRHPWARHRGGAAPRRDLRAGSRGMRGPACTIVHQLRGAPTCIAPPGLPGGGPLTRRNAPRRPDAIRGHPRADQLENR